MFECVQSWVLLWPVVWSASSVSFVLYFLSLQVYTCMCTVDKVKEMFLSLGNTQEMVSFIISSRADNCSATGAQMWKWRCARKGRRVFAHMHMSASPQSAVKYCPLAINLILLPSHFLPLPKTFSQLSMWSEGNFCWNCVVSIDCGVWGLILLLLPSRSLFCAKM